MRAALADAMGEVCDGGVVVDFIECAGAGHSEAAAAILPYALDWMADPLAGVPLEVPCVVHEPVACVGLG